MTQGADASSEAPTASPIHNGRFSVLDEHSEEPAIQATDTPAEAHTEAQAASPIHDGRPPTLDEHSKALVTPTTTQEADTPVKAQADTQLAGPIHDGLLEQSDPRVRGVLEKAGDPLQAQRKPDETVSAPASGQQSTHDGRPRP